MTENEKVEAVEKIMNDTWSIGLGQNRKERFHKLATAIVAVIGGDKKAIWLIIYKFCGESVVVDCANGIKSVEAIAEAISQNPRIIEVRG